MTICSQSLIGWPLIAAIRSPDYNFAFSAGESLAIDATTGGTFG
ncbi:hypothetical protein CBUD_1462b [Coxiella burnetii Dugway 5J108-111]|uniref:Uncharacterized protein n=1 Tax=Coxiella burnetii (strain Dugway 5J108-111) TaxID=434922 RepID=B5XHF4_COXBN|nr:hypothetical protein CBUD_1462b [Coxiella burnetii Dugway 5J108-111]